MDKQELNDRYSYYFDAIKKDCQYGTLKKHLLLHEIVYSINETRLRETFWIDRNISLEQAIDRCTVCTVTSE